MQVRRRKKGNKDFQKNKKISLKTYYKSRASSPFPLSHQPQFYFLSTIFINDKEN